MDNILSHILLLLITTLAERKCQFKANTHHREICKKYQTTFEMTRR